MAVARRATRRQPASGRRAGELGVAEFEPVLGRAEARQLLVLLAGCELVENVDGLARYGEHRHCSPEGVRGRVVFTRRVPDVGGKLGDEIQRLGGFQSWCIAWRRNAVVRF